MWFLCRSDGGFFGSVEFRGRDWVVDGFCGGVCKGRFRCAFMLGVSLNQCALERLWVHFALECVRSKNCFDRWKKVYVPYFSNSGNLHRVGRI